LIRGGILITGTEVLTGIIVDKNGPWLSEQMRKVGIQPAQITIVGDRPEDLVAALESMRTAKLDLIVTSGGLGPTADDLTAEVVGNFQGREMVLDEPLEARIGEILAGLSARWPNLDMDSVRAANRKQAVIPAGSQILDPVGTAPGLIVPPSSPEGPVILVLPGPPRELKPMWHTALESSQLKPILDAAPDYERRIVRMFGIPESELASALKEMEDRGIDFTGLEVTTCLRRGEIEIATTFEEEFSGGYSIFESALVERFGELIHAFDGATIDETVAKLLADSSLAVGESCTGGLFAGRLTDLSGASGWFRGGVVAYSNEAKVSLLNVDPEVIDAEGAVSEPVAVALAEGARSQFGSDFGVGITGIAGPDGGTEDKPVGFVWFAVVGPRGKITRSVIVPGGRADIRDRATTIGLHLVRRLAMDSAAS
jgi:nicotinamide-nucleotide amidase